MCGCSMVIAEEQSTVANNVAGKHYRQGKSIIEGKIDILGVYIRKDLEFLLAYQGQCSSHRLGCRIQVPGHPLITR